ncbi:MAG: VWA domain-containing protein [Myxococcus sp.]|nr:VWA domain-containing protein [Myxococcus sp.]
MAIAFLASCEGCFGCKTSPLDATGSTIPRSCKAEAPLIEPQKLDILFVIDNSNSMREEQEAVARELTAFVNQIKQAGGVRQDFNVGVITTSVYQHSNQNGVVFVRDYPTQSGRLQPVPDLGPDGGVQLGTGTERLLSGEDPNLVDKFSRLVQQGVSGSGQETPFEAVRLALMTDLIKKPLAEGGNGGFLRDGARLLIVVLTDEDDCSETMRPSRVTVSDNPAIAYCTEQSNSLTTVSEYHRLFSQELKNEDGLPKEVIWTAIAPVGRETKAAMQLVDNGQVRNIDCPTSNQGGFRQRQMAELFDPSLINLDSICRDSFRETLITIAELASVSQTIEVKNAPDPAMIQLSITRKSGAVVKCTQLNGGLLSVTPVEASSSTRIRFGGECKRRADDQGIGIRLLCAT